MKIVAIRCHILCTSAPQTPRLDLRGPTFKGKAGRRKEGDERGTWEGGGGKGEWGSPSWI